MGNASKNLFRKEADYWTITYGGVTFHLKDAKGLHYLVHLLRHPGREFHALDLVRVAGAREAEGRRLERPAAVGLGGRDRLLSSEAERARLAVTKGLKTAIEKIRINNASLGHHLVASIKTGQFCSYTPDPERPVSWVL